jgi:hypothetical protein
VRYGCLLAIFALGCQGQVGDAPGPGVDPFDPPPGYCASAPAMLGRVPVRRLSRVEYMNTVDDLLYGVARSGPEIPEDATEGGFGNAARHLSAPALLVERYELTASQAAEAAMADAETRGRILARPRRGAPLRLRSAGGPRDPSSSAGAARRAAS